MAVVFIPGIKGTELVDSYPLDHPRRWPRPGALPGDMLESPREFTLIDGQHDIDGHWMQPGRLVHALSGPIMHKLRAWLAPEPVYAFGYDWRKPLEDAARRLVTTCEQVLARERAAGRPAELKFVTHSMGGLLLRSALALRDPREPLADVARIVFIAPPFRGALGAPFALVAGETDAWFGTGPNYRKLARGFPSVYQITPSWPGAAVDEDGGDVDLFDPVNWQANVARGQTFRPNFLRNAEAFVCASKAHHGGHSAAPMLSDAALAKAADKVLVICGSGQPTPRALPVLTRNHANPNWFDFAHMRIDIRGDGRVWMASAAIKGVTLAAFADSGEHALLCRDERIAQLTVRWLAEGRATILQPRTASDPMTRPEPYFQPWDGAPESLDRHIALSSST
jgi:hypothetical protein